MRRERERGGDISQIPYFYDNRPRKVGALRTADMAEWGRIDSGGPFFLSAWVSRTQTSRRPIENRPAGCNPAPPHGQVAGRIAGAADRVSAPLSLFLRNSKACR